MIMWANRTAKYPYVSRETWWTRYHLLRRKIMRQGHVTTNDRRVARILSQRVSAEPRLACPRTSEAQEVLSVIIDG